MDQSRVSHTLQQAVKAASGGQVKHDDRHPYMEVSMAMGVSQDGWFIREHPIKMDDLGVPPFVDPPRFT